MKIQRARNTKRVVISRASQRVAPYKICNHGKSRVTISFQPFTNQLLWVLFLVLTRPEVAFALRGDMESTPWLDHDSFDVEKMIPKDLQQHAVARRFSHFV